MKKATNDIVVLFTLAIANTPLSVPELAFRCNKSYNTIKKIISSDDRVIPVGKNPTRYMFATPEMFSEEIVRLHGDTPKEGWVAWIEKIHNKVAELIKVDKTRAPNDVLKQAIVVEALAVNLIMFARELKQHADKPDWFALMGGVENE